MLTGYCVNLGFRCIGNAIPLRMDRAFHDLAGAHCLGSFTGNILDTVAAFQLPFWMVLILHGCLTRFGGCRCLFCCNNRYDCDTCQ